MALTREEVLNVAKLARLKFTPEEIEKFHRGQLRCKKIFQIFNIRGKEI